MSNKRSISRRQFLKSVGASASVTIAGIALAGCGGLPAATQPATAPTTASAAVTAAPVSSEPVTIKVWKAPHKPAGEEVKIAETTLAGFHSLNPNIKVEYTEVPWDKYGEALIAAFASGDPPDITYQTEGIAQYIVESQVEALDTWFSQEGGLKDTFYPQTFEPATMNGKVYGMPFVFAGNSLLWNKDLFEKAGLDPEKPPETWDDIVTFGKKLTKPDEDQYGFMIGPRTALEFHGWNTVYWPLNAGGKWTNEDFTEIYLDDERGIFAAEFYGDLFNKHKITPPAEIGKVTGQLQSMFNAGKGGFAFEVNSAIANIRTASPDLKLGIGPKPKGPASDPKWARAGYGSVGYLALSTGSKHKAEAWEVMKYLTEPEALKSWIKLLGWQPVLKDLSFAEGDPMLQAVEANLANSIMVNNYMPDKPYRGDIMEEFLTQYEAIALGRKTGKEAMIEGAQRMRALIKARS